MKLGGVNGFLPYAPTASLMAKSREGPIPMVQSDCHALQFNTIIFPNAPQAQEEQQHMAIGMLAHTALTPAVA